MLLSSHGDTNSLKRAHTHIHTYTRHPKASSPPFPPPPRTCATGAGGDGCRGYCTSIALHVEARQIEHGRTLTNATQINTTQSALRQGRKPTHFFWWDWFLRQVTWQPRLVDSPCQKGKVEKLSAGYDYC